MKKILLAGSLLALLLVGCSTGSKQSAKVIDSAVEGLEYQCAGNVDYTPKDGSLVCYQTPIGFKIGGVKIGVIKKIPGDGIILPQDMVNASRSNLNSSDVKKLTILLQTIDKDNNPENGITITKEDAKKLNVFIDLQKMSLNDFKELIEGLLEKEAVDETKALTHLYKSMKKFNIKEANAINLDELK